MKTERSDERDPVTAPIVAIATAEPMLDPQIARSRYVGDVEVRRVNEALGTPDVLVNLVSLGPGARTRPHAHSFDQLVYYVSGVGIVHLAGGEEQRIAAGECAMLPAGVPHMHGAAEDGPAAHLSMMRDVDLDFDCAIPPGWEHWRSQ